MDFERYIRLFWFEKVDGFTRCVMRIFVSRTGLLTDLSHSPWYIATSKVNIVRERAISLARPYAESYAKQHGRKIESIGATLALLRDDDGSRGDPYAMYPCWVVSFNFSKPYKQNVFGYCVWVWADNGMIWDHNPQGYYDYPLDEDLSADEGLGVSNGANPYLPFIVAITVAAAFTVVIMYSKHRSKVREAIYETLS